MALNDSGSPQPCEVRSGDGSVVRLASVTAVISGAPSNGRKLLANLKAAADAGDLDFDSVAAALHDTVVATNPRGIGAVLDGDQPIAFLFDRAQLRGQVDLAGEGRTGWTTEAIPAGMVEVTVGDELGVVDPRIELVEGRVGGTGTSLLLGGAAVGGISDTTGSSLPARPTLSSSRADLSSAPTASVAASAAAQQLDLTEPDLGQASGTGDDQPAGSAAEITIAASETASVADIDLSDASSTPDADSGDDTEVEAETISAEVDTFSAEVETETIDTEVVADTFSAEVETETIDTEVVAFSAEATLEVDEADGNVEDPAEGNLDADSGTDGDDEASSESFGAGASVAGVAAGGAVGLTASQWVSGQASKDDENDDDEKAAASDSPDDVGGSGFGAAERDWAQATPAPTTSGWNRRDDTFDDIPSTFPRSTPPDQQADGPSPGDSQPAPRVPPGSVAAAAADLASAPPAGQPSPPPPGLSDAPPPGLSDAPPTGLPRTPPPPPPTGPPVDVPPSPYGAAPPPPPPPGAFDMTAPPTGQPVDVPPSSYGAAVPPPPPPPTDSAPSSEAPSGAMAPPPPGAFPAPSPNVPPIPNVPSSEVPPVPPPGFSAAEPPPMPPPGFSAAEPPPMPPPGYGASEPPPSPSAGFSGSIPPIPGGVADHIPPIPDNPAGGDPQGSNSLFDRLRSAADGATSRIPPVPGAERSGTESSEGVEVPDQLKGSGKGFSGLFPNRSSDSDTDRTERNDGDQD